MFPVKGDLKKRVEYILFSFFLVFASIVIGSCDMILEAAVSAAGGNLPQVETPIFSLAAGTYTSVPQIVTITTTTETASIRYTLDGSTPTSTVGIPYTAPIVVTTDETITAIAYATDWADSSVAQARYRFWLTFGTQGSGINQFYKPKGLAMDAIGRIYIADGNNRIVRINDMTGAGWTTFGSFGSGINQFNSPFGIALDNSWRIYVTDDYNDRIVRINDMTGAGWTTLGVPNSPYDVSVDTSGRIYIGEYWQIERTDNMTGLGRITFGTFGDGINQFFRASAIAVKGGYVYIADGGGNGRIVRINDMYGTGWITLGRSGWGIYEFGLNSYGMMVDANGRIYVADTSNYRIVRMTMQ